jgi:hypothetical protein
VSRPAGIMVARTPPGARASKPLCTNSAEASIRRKRGFLVRLSGLAPPSSLRAILPKGGFTGLDQRTDYTRKLFRDFQDLAQLLGKFDRGMLHTLAGGQ